MTAVFAGFAGLAAAGLLSAPGAPTPTQARTAAAAAIPQQPARLAGPEAACAWCPTWDGGPLERSDFVAAGYHPPSEQVAAVMAQAHARLASAGWRLDPEVHEDEGTLHFAADKGGTTVSLTGELGRAYLDKDLGRPDPAFVPVTLVVTRTFSAVRVLTLAAGFLGGLLAGWLATAWVLQRFRRHRPAIRATVLLTGLPVMLLAVALDLLAAQWVLGLALFAGWSPRFLMLPADLAGAAPQVPVAVAVIVVITAAAAALPTGTRGGSRPATASPAP